MLCQLDSAVQTIALLRALRAGEIALADPAIPVLVVGADSDHDAIRYYQAGADSTLPTASPPLLITAALDALARRTGGQQRSRRVRVGRLTIDRDARTVRVDEQPLHLTRLEFDLLDLLASQPGKAFTRAEITRQVWGYDPDATGPSRTTHSTAHRLRKKLEHTGAGPIPHTVRGVGWRLGA